MSTSPVITASLGLVKVYALYVFVMKAYTIRLHAIEEYGLVIHEFDPWFNYRATEYLDENGAAKFFTWFDYMSWYPLGRPVGTTIYPGLQLTSVFIKNTLANTPYALSLNDVCCYVPAWFGAIASALTGLLCYTVTGNKSATVFTTGIMAIVPAHLMRSIGGGYDNESIAVAAMVLTFLCWLVSLKNIYTAILGGFATAVAYGYMVAAWGGYVFVLNMIGMHAFVLLLFRFDRTVHVSYSIFYVVGTAFAIQVPVVGLTPLKSLEQLAPCAVFLAMQVVAVGEYLLKQRKMTHTTFTKKWTFRIQLYAITAVVGVVLLAAVLPVGYFGPLSSRVRGLFVRHTRTGNPLVDSVAEHQPASSQAYYQYLQVLCQLTPVGFAAIAVTHKFDNKSLFLVLYAATTYFFSAKMVRLIILTGPIAAILSGYLLGLGFDWSTTQMVQMMVGGKDKEEDTAAAAAPGKSKKGTPAKSSKSKSSAPAWMPRELGAAFEAGNKQYDSTEGKFFRKIAAVGFFFALFSFGTDFLGYCDKMSHALSNPSIMFKAQLKSGQTIIVDDYREAYWWLRDNTPEDSRVMAWWDYGYQITGIARRTTIADGNTWNHEHIALLGRTLTSPEKEAHRVARHLADYVLIWAGGGGDDLAKSPHMARIANSVYRDVCPGDPTCRMFGFTDKYGTPTPMMEASLLYKLHGHGQKPGVSVDPNRFQEVFSSKYGKVRIFKVLGVSQESKEWVSDLKNRDCDVEGGWFCRGVYPPALESTLNKKNDFAQLEDFNKKKNSEQDAAAYQKQYMENMNDPAKAAAAAAAKKREIDAAAAEDREIEAPPRERYQPSKSELEQARDEMSTRWEDNEVTTRMWELINAGDVDELAAWLQHDPTVAYVRSVDGRGPMFWAYEYKSQDIVKLLMSVGVRISDKDKDGKTPRD